MYRPRPARHGSAKLRNEHQSQSVAHRLHVSRRQFANPVAERCAIDGDDLRDVGHGVLRKAGITGGNEYVAGCIGQPDVRSDHDRNRGRYPAPVERVRLYDQQRPPEPRSRSCRRSEICPPYFASLHLPLRPAHNVALRPCHRRIDGRWVRTIDGIQSLADAPSRVPGDVLLERGGIQAASGQSEATSERLPRGKQVVRKRNGCLHTVIIPLLYRPGLDREQRKIPSIAGSDPSTPREISGAEQTLPENVRSGPSLVMPSPVTPPVRVCRRGIDVRLTRQRQSFAGNSHRDDDRPAATIRRPALACRGGDRDRPHRCQPSAGQGRSQ